MFVGTENGSITVPDPDPLEQMLIEHPSMSVYQRRCGVTEEEEEEEEPLDTDEDLCRLRSFKPTRFHSHGLHQGPTGSVKGFGSHVTRQLDDHMVPKLRPLDLINKQQHLEKPQDERMICARTCAWKSV